MNSKKTIGVFAKKYGYNNLYRILRDELMAAEIMDAAAIDAMIAKAIPAMTAKIVKGIKKSPVERIEKKNRQKAGKF